MPKNESRPVEITFHARRRLRLRGITDEQVTHAAHAGSWEPNGEDGHMIARAHVDGFSLEVAIVVYPDRLVVKSVFWA